METTTTSIRITEETRKKIRVAAAVHDVTIGRLFEGMFNYLESLSEKEANKIVLFNQKNNE